MNKNTIVHVLITCMVFVNFFIYSNIITNNIPVSEQNFSTSGEELNFDNSDVTTTEVESLPLDSKYIYLNVDDTYCGELVLINKNYGYSFDAVPTIVKNASNISVYSAKSASYFVNNINVSMDSVAIEALNRMMDDFYAQNGNKKCVIVTQGLRTYEEQQKMLELKISQFGENQTIAQIPGFSEHHTGYAFDISTYVNGIMGTFTGENEYKWVHENAHKYGFILRYPAGKEEITGISYESWHFRYVGTPHAQYMYRNNLTLEEYTSAIMECKFGESELSVTDEVTGQVYTIYSVPVENDGVQVPVPSSAAGKEYSLSGNNCGYVVVTVKE